MLDDWRLRRYPELAVCYTPAERTEVFRLCADGVQDRLRNRILLVGGLLTLGGATAYRLLFWPLLCEWIPWLAGGEPPGIPLALVLAVALFLGHRIFIAPCVQAEIRRELAGRGYLVCVHCGYDLRAQTELRCPECGLAFVLPQEKTQKGDENNAPPGAGEDSVGPQSLPKPPKSTPIP